MKKTVLYKIKSEFLLQDRISTDVLVDALATKRLAELFCRKGDYIKGFIQEVVQSPYGINCSSLIQVSSITYLHFVEYL